MSKAKQRTIVGLLAVLAVTAAALLAVFGLPYGASNPDAFAHVYTLPANGNTTHLHIDADMSTPCTAPYDATVALGVHEVGVCIEDYEANTVDQFQLTVFYTGDPTGYPLHDPPILPDTINTAATVAYGGSPKACPPGGTDTGCLNANPDANDGIDDVTGLKLGDGWDCTGMKLAPPKGDDPATVHVADAFIVCNADVSAPDLDLAADPGLLATIEFTATTVGVDTIDFGPLDATNTTNVTNPRLVDPGDPDADPPVPPTYGPARCGTGVAADQVGCFGAKVTKAYPPDLSVTKVCPASPVLINSNFSCTVTVTNVGQGAASAVGLLDVETTAAKSLNFLSAVPSQGGCLTTTGTGGNVGCALGAIAGSGGSATVTINFKAAGPEGINTDRATAAVTSGLADPSPDPHPNSATADVDEFKPDITVHKWNVSGGGHSAADGWTMALYNTADCTGTAVATGVTAGGTVNFPNVGDALTPLPKTYCVKETLPSSAWGRKNCTTGADMTDLTQPVVVDGVDKVENIEFCNALLVATEAYDKGASAEPASVTLPAGGSATVSVSEVVYVVEAGPSPTIVHTWTATPHGNVSAAWAGDGTTLVFSTGPYVNGDEFTVSKNITVTCTGAGGGYVDLALQVGAANNPPVSPAQIIVNCETGGMTKSPASANLWLCIGVNCRDINGPLQGRGQLVIAENVSGITGDPLGAGAFEFQIKFDHKIFDIVITETNWLWSTPGRIKPAGACAMTIINESDIRFACVSEGTGHGPTASGTIANLLVTPDPDMQYRLTPGQNNGVVRTILDENCEFANILGDPIAGSLPGGMMPSCGRSTITVRILEGDLNLDCAVNVIDEQAISFRYGSSFGNLLYDPWYDLEPALKDYDIDIKDLQKVFGRDGSNCSAPIPAQAPQPPSP
jgi:hypothetical protein